jgi:hypothetical protein
MRDRPNLGSFLSHAYIASGSSQSVDLRFAPAYRFHYSEVTKKHNRDEIVKMLSTFTGIELEVHMTLEAQKAEAQVQNYIKQIGNIQPSIDDEIEKEPVIQTILDMFDGEIIG